MPFGCSHFNNSQKLSLLSLLIIILFKIIQFYLAVEFLLTFLSDRLLLISALLLGYCLDDDSVYCVYIWIYGAQNKLKHTNFSAVRLRYLF